MHRLVLTPACKEISPADRLPPFGRITGIRFYGYNLSPLFLGTPFLILRGRKLERKWGFTTITGVIHDKLWESPREFYI